MKRINFSCRKKFRVSFLSFCSFTVFIFILCGYPSTKHSYVKVDNPQSLNGNFVLRSAFVRRLLIADSGHLVPWSSFEADHHFRVHNCLHNLDMTAWNNEVLAKICLLPPHQDEHISASIRNKRMWEYDNQLHLFKTVLPKYPEAAFVDIGAQLGLYTISAAKLGRKVFAFEPNSNTFRFLVNSIALNELQDKVSLFPYALMDRRYECINLSVPSSSNTGHTVVDVRNATCCDKSKPNVKVATLDDLVYHLDKQGKSQAIIKVDVEAAEPLVLRGGQNFLNLIHVPNILMEIDEMKKKFQSGNEREKRDIHNLLQLMTRLKYSAIPIGGLKNMTLNVSSFPTWPVVDVLWELGQRDD